MTQVLEVVGWRLVVIASCATQLLTYASQLLLEAKDLLLEFFNR